MKKKWLTIFLLSGVYGSLHAQGPSNFNSFIVTDVGPTELRSVNTEIPPWIIGGGGQFRSYFTTDGSKSYVSSEPYDLITNPIIYFGAGYETSSNAGCLGAVGLPGNLTINSGVTGYQKATNSIALEPGFESDGNNGDLTAGIVNGLWAGQDWRRSYYNIYTAQYLQHPVEGGVSIGFLDAENKAVCESMPGNGFSRAYCPGTLMPYKPSYDVPGYTWNNCNNQGDYWQTMAAFVCGKWIHNNESTNWGQGYFDNDMGPVVWPSNGYLLPNGQKISRGVGLPSSIIWDGYLYVFYHDDGPQTLPGDPAVPEEEGRREGIKVARVLLSEALEPHAYRTYYKDPNGNEHWDPSIPGNFDKDHMDLFWSEKGPKATDVMNDPGTTAPGQFANLRFSVAHVANSNPSYFVGVESYQDVADNWSWHVAIRFSYDLLNWTERKRILIDAPDWTSLNFNYPIFCDAAGWSNTEVDINDFYVLGQGPDIDNTISKLHIYNPGPRKAVSPVTDKTNSSDLTNKAHLASSSILPTPNHGNFRLSYTLTQTATIQLSVLDVTGRKVYTASPGTKGAGSYFENIDISSFANGVYLIELMVDGSRQLLKTVKH